MRDRHLGTAMRSGIAIAPEHCENVSGIAGRAPRLWLYPSSAWRQMIETSTPGAGLCRSCRRL
jgi:Tripartite tricarboxylate transporter TctA family